MMDALPVTTSTRPYLIRAMHEWCSDNGFTPYISVWVDSNTQVPLEHVKNNEIILNISYDATSALQLGNEFISCKSRFSGQVRELMIPVHNIQAIFAKENGQGMTFPRLADTEITNPQNTKPPMGESKKMDVNNPSPAKPVAPKRSSSHLTVVK